MKKALSLIVLLCLQTPVFAEMATQPQNSVNVKKTMTVLESHLKKKYSAYKVDITSDYPGTLKLESASIDNGVVGQVAASHTRTSWINLLWGLPGWLIGMGIAAIVISHKNGNAETEAAEYPNQVPANTLISGSKITFNALVPLGQQPELRLHFVDPKTSKSFDKVAMLY